MIPFSECKPGWTYQIIARNASVGIFDSEKRGFVIRRYKFGHINTFVELHWEVDDRFGTAQPIKEIEEAPELKTEQEILDYLGIKTKELEDLEDYVLTWLDKEDFAKTLIHLSEANFRKKEI